MSEPRRGEIDRIVGPVLLEFGASWCPHCRAIQPSLKAMLAENPEVRHIPWRMAQENRWAAPSA